jgi:nucleotide-binding universal stress UspA family protein
LNARRITIKEKAMFTKLLVPLDGSKTAEKALPYARYLAQDKNVVVELLAAVDVANMASHMSAERALHVDTMVEDAVRASEKYLQAIAGTFTAAKIKTAVETGRPEEVIVEKAAAEEDTLITMATHGRSGMNRWLLGSVAEKVLRGATGPVLLIRAREGSRSEDGPPPKSLIVPLDGSDLAERVLPKAMEFAKQKNLEIVLIRAYHIPTTAYAGVEGYALPMDDLLKSMREEACEYLEKKVADVNKLGIAKVSFTAREGLPADEVISFAKNLPRGLIAMSTHGRSGVRRWVLGSVTETVVRHSENPVLVIRATST